MIINNLEKIFEGIKDIHFEESNGKWKVADFIFGLVTLVVNRNIDNE